MAVLINPVLGTTTVLATLGREEQDRLSSPQKNIVNLFRQQKMPLSVILPMLNHYGWPESLIGAGSFAGVFDDPRFDERVLKFSFDEIDGLTSSYIQTVQEGKVKAELSQAVVKRHLPLVYSVGLLEFEELVTRRKRAVWIINIEKIEPLTHADYQKTQAVPAIIRGAFEDYLKHAQEQVINFMASKRVRKESYANIPQHIRDSMMESMYQFISQLRKLARAAYTAGNLVERDVLLSAAASADTLLQLGIPAADLHAGNWGFKSNGELVVIDFGLSSLQEAQQDAAYAGATEYRISAKTPKPREHPGQMKLFKNPSTLPRILQELQELGLSVEHLARYGGVMPPVLHEWLSGKRLAPKKQVERFYRLKLAYKLPPFKVGQEVQVHDTREVLTIKDLKVEPSYYGEPLWYVHLSDGSWLLASDVASSTAQNPGLSHKELVALTRAVLGGPEALRMKDYHVDTSTVRSLIRKGYFVKEGVSSQGRKLVESLGTKAPLF